ncbi:hypothetical protein CONPUDRAFT_73828 [Coniophora puteana RWD-64-598 SS2]|uniref:Uncharacterized protein n=1 Tax=Coniophora puteana (strain RWD-64-598) TaxID=741705 RepID=A0A5M3MNV4_CONPW|nr:uncharacterized protein CONPUDRAFT_73828 [Coniophora puteana RWD-64-598 SS2]EIW80793.1 hypothetical protein CONPUDRAFT_73828 [Coniophora puteana RWD-64-598 SS2]
MGTVTYMEFYSSKAADTLTDVSSLPELKTFLPSAISNESQISEDLVAEDTAPLPGPTATTWLPRAVDDPESHLSLFVDYPNFPPSLPALCVGDETIIASLLTSAVYQRLTWGVNDPIVGLAWSSTSPVVRVFVACLSPDAQDDLSQTHNPQGGWFDLSVPSSKRAFIHYLSTVIHRGANTLPKTMHPSRERVWLQWRSDFAKAETVLDKMASVATWTAQTASAENPDSSTPVDVLQPNKITSTISSQDEGLLQRWSCWEYVTALQCKTMTHNIIPIASVASGASNAAKPWGAMRRWLWNRVSTLLSTLPLLQSMHIHPAYASLTRFDRECTRALPSVPEEYQALRSELVNVLSAQLEDSQAEGPRLSEYVSIDLRNSLEKVLASCAQARLQRDDVMRLGTPVAVDHIWDALVSRLMYGKSMKVRHSAPVSLPRSTMTDRHQEPEWVEWVQFTARQFAMYGWEQSKAMGAIARPDSSTARQAVDATKLLDIYPGLAGDTFSEMVPLANSDPVEVFCDTAVMLDFFLDSDMLSRTKVPHPPPLPPVDPCNDEGHNTTTPTGASSSADPVSLDLPLLFVNHSPPENIISGVGSHKHRMCATAGAAFLAATGLIGVPVFSLVTDGCRGVITCVWAEVFGGFQRIKIAEKNGVLFDLTNPLSRRLKQEMGSDTEVDTNEELNKPGPDKETDEEMSEEEDEEEDEENDQMRQPADSSILTVMNDQNDSGGEPVKSSEEAPSDGQTSGSLVGGGMGAQGPGIGRGERADGGGNRGGPPWRGFAVPRGRGTGRFVPPGPVQVTDFSTGQGVPAQAHTPTFRVPQVPPTSQTRHREASVPASSGERPSKRPRVASVPPGGPAGFRSPWSSAQSPGEDNGARTESPSSLSSPISLPSPQISSSSPFSYPSSLPSTPAASSSDGDLQGADANADLALDVLPAQLLMPPAQPAVPPPQPMMPLTSQAPSARGANTHLPAPAPRRPPRLNAPVPSCTPTAHLPKSNVSFAITDQVSEHESKLSIMHERMACMQSETRAAQETAKRAMEEAKRVSDIAERLSGENVYLRDRLTEMEVNMDERIAAGVGASDGTGTRGRENALQTAIREQFLKVLKITDAAKIADYEPLENRAVIDDEGNAHPNFYKSWTQNRDWHDQVAQAISNAIKNNVVHGNEIMEGKNIGDIKTRLGVAWKNWTQGQRNGQKGKKKKSPKAESEARRNGRKLNKLGARINVRPESRWTHKRHDWFFTKDAQSSDESEDEGENLGKKPEVTFESDGEQADDLKGKGKAREKGKGKEGRHISGKTWVTKVPKYRSEETEDMVDNVSQAVERARSSRGPPAHARVKLVKVDKDLPIIQGGIPSRAVETDWLYVNAKVNKSRVNFDDAVPYDEDGEQGADGLSQAELYTISAENAVLAPETMQLVEQVAVHQYADPGPGTSAYHMGLNAQTQEQGPAGLVAEYNADGNLYYYFVDASGQVQGVASEDDVREWQGDNGGYNGDDEGRGY